MPFLELDFTRNNYANLLEYFSCNNHLNFLVFSAFDRSGLFYKFVVRWKYQLSVYFPNPSLGGKKDSIVREVVCYIGYRIAMTILLLVFACCTRCQVLEAVRKTPDNIWASRKQGPKSQQS